MADHLDGRGIRANQTMSQQDFEHDNLHVEEYT
jgi:hypothetical protein